MQIKVCTPYFAFSTQKVNKILLEMDFLEEKTRLSVTNGKNMVNPRKSEETPPADYTNTFTDLFSQDFRLADQTLNCLD